MAGLWNLKFHWMAFAMMSERANCLRSASRRMMIPSWSELRRQRLKYATGECSSRPQTPSSVRFWPVLTLFTRRKAAVDLHPGIESLFRRLEQADWFCGVGLWRRAHSSPVNGWAQALEVRGSRTSDDASIEGRDEQSEPLEKHTVAGPDRRRG